MLLKGLDDQHIKLFHRMREIIYHSSNKIYETFLEFYKKYLNPTRMGEGMNKTYFKVEMQMTKGT